MEHAANRFLLPKGDDRQDREVNEVENQESGQRILKALGSFTVMSANIQGQPSWHLDEPRKQWATRAPLVREVIEHEQPDIIGFQEFGETTQEDIFDAWKDSPYETYKGEPVNDIFINPIAWNVDKFIMRDRFTRWLTPDGKFGKAWGGIERGYSGVLLEHRATSQAAWVYSVHLDNQSALARKEGTRHVIADAKERADDLPTIITADLNTTTQLVPPPPYDDYYETKAPIIAQSDLEVFKHFEAAGFIDTNPARQSVNGQPPEPTFHAYLGEDIYQQPDRFGTWNPDAILVRSLSIEAFKIITTHRDEVYPSDHYPIQATLSDAA